MESSRNNQGRFVTGHKGSKPKGAINKSTRAYLARLDKISKLLEANLPGNINKLSAKEQVMFWFEIEKFKHLKLSKFTEPDPEKEPITKITFELVGADGKTIDDPPVSPPAPLTETAAPLESGQVRPANSASVQCGSIDVGRVKRSNDFPRFRSI